VTCSVCGRQKAQHLKVSDVVIDDVNCRVCEECGGDMFRRRRAVEIALGKPRSCDCETCKLRENGGGRQLAIPAAAHE
jgi:hypothetical protein